MIEKKIKIFAASQVSQGQTREIEVNEKEKSAFLNCKFYDESLEKMLIFSQYYYPAVGSDVVRLIGILSGEYLKPNQSFETSDRKLFKAIRIYHDLGYKDLKKNARVKLDGYLIDTNGKIPKDGYYSVEDIHHLEPIIQTIIKGCVDKEIDLSTISTSEILDWAEVKGRIFDKRILKQARDRIALTQISVFIDGSPVNENNFYIVKPILLSIYYMSYADLKVILFPNHDLFSQLQEAKDKGELNFWLFSNVPAGYFNPLRVIAWLIANNLASPLLMKEFIKLKHQLIKAAQVDWPEMVYSLQTLINKTGYDRDFFLQKALKGGIRIYLRYPPEKYIEWGAAPKKIDPSQSVETTRYKGLGQILKKNEDHIFSKSFGGVTVEMLLYGEEPDHTSPCGNKMDHKIILIPTKEELEHHFLPELKVPHDEMKNLIADDNVMMLESDISQYLPSNKNDSYASPIIPLTDETLETYKKGKNLEERSRIYAQEGTKEIKKTAISRWQPFMDLALEKATKNPEQYTAVHLVRILKKNDSGKFGWVKVPTATKKINQNNEIVSLLKPHKNRSNS